MIVSYEEYKVYENENPVEQYDVIVDTVIENLYEHGNLTESDMEDLFGFINESLESYNVDIFSLLNDYAHIIDESYDEELGENVYSLTNRGIRLYELNWNIAKKFKNKNGGETDLNLGSQKPGLVHQIGGFAQGMHANHVAGQAKQAQIAQKTGNIKRKHDYRMAKLSAKSKDNAFDSYTKLSGTQNMRDY